jgi:hypothetical protein
VDTAPSDGVPATANSSLDFSPYYEINDDQDVLNVYFRPDGGYSKRFTERVTLYYSIGTDEIAGCQIKGILELFEDRPSFINASHGGVELPLIFWFLGSIAGDEATRDIFHQFAAKAADERIREFSCMAEANRPPYYSSLPTLDLVSVG